MGIYQDQANLLKVMAHPVRLRMLDILCRDSECVCHLSAALDKRRRARSLETAR